MLKLPVLAWIGHSVSGRRPSQKVKVLKQPSVTVWDCDYVMSVKSQTFPEGKGVETSDINHPPSILQIQSQTFPEGKGVETQRCTQLQAELCGRRPSQKVKVLKPVVELLGLQINCGRRPSQKVKVLKLQPLTGRFHLLAQSQTFPEGKGVETQSSIPHS